MALRNIRDLNGNLLEVQPGWRFVPSDKDLVVVYLRRKVHSIPLPNDAIPDIPDVFRNPWELPGEDGEKKFFFCARTGNTSCIINTDSGYWRHNVNQDLRIVDWTNSVVGIKKSWVFFHSVESNGSRWIMHEISLVRPFEARLTEELLVEVGEWNVYRIYDESNEEESEDDLDGSESSDEPNSPISIFDAFQSREL